jgi:hypothetical protein
METALNRSGTAAPDVADDLLDGCEKIAQFLGMKPRQIYYQVYRQRLPVFRIGEKICARKSTLIAHISRLEAGE